MTKPATELGFGIAARRESDNKVNLWFGDFTMVGLDLDRARVVRDWLSEQIGD